MATVVVAALAWDWRLWRDRRRLRVQVRELALRDGLTGLPSRSRWEAEARREVEKARRYDRPLSLIVLDVDALETVNQEHGSAAGDAVLAAVGGRLEDMVRASDLPVRLGGDEFAILLPETALDEAALVARSLSGRVSRLTVPAGRDDLPVSVSVGVAAMPAARSFDELLVAAEDARYDAKRAGPSHVEIARPRP